MKKQKVILITGANSGVGKATSIELAKNGDCVVMLCRDKNRGEQALSDVKEASKNKDVELMLCDLSSLSDIKNFCREFKEKYNRLDVLINNAGVILPGRHLTKDGFELQFQVNYLAPVLINKLLLGIMVKGSRIINVSSGAHKIGKIFFEDVNLTKNYRLWRAYAQSKLALTIYTYELSRRLENSGITVNSVHPGAVASSMGINRDTGFGTFITRLLKPFFLTPLKGAETSIYLATSSDVSNVSGKYFYKKKPVKTSKISYDKELGNKLWDYTENLLSDALKF